MAFLRLRSTDRSLTGRLATITYTNDNMQNASVSDRSAERKLKNAIIETITVFLILHSLFF
jgi:hypothetical protein